MPPAKGPMYQIQKLSQSPERSSGPKARAGFIAAPVIGPAIRMSSVIVRPIARPAIDLNVPRGSAAVAKTTQTRKKVRIASMIRSRFRLEAGPDPGAPRVPWRSPREDPFQERCGGDGAPNCAIQYDDGDRSGRAGR